MVVVRGQEGMLRTILGAIVFGTVIHARDLAYGPSERLIERQMPSPVTVTGMDNRPHK